MGGNQREPHCVFLAMHGLMQCQKCGKCPKKLYFEGGGKPKRIIDLLLLLVCQTGGRMWHGPLYYLEFSAKFGNI